MNPLAECDAVMCNNAGIATEVEKGLSLRIHDTPTENYDRTHALNQRAVWLGCKYAITQMLAQEPREANARGDRTRGWIINTASMLGLIGLAHGPCYVPAKHAVVGITRQVAIDYAKERIHCNCLCPGFVKSAMIDSLIPTDEHEKGLGELRMRGSVRCDPLANRLHSGCASLGDAWKAGGCCGCGAFLGK
jgi:NAD(P)-dependent dehydrogenase (short-subunit alcohol dehydrogenase family)